PLGHELHAKQEHAAIDALQLNATRFAPSYYFVSERVAGDGNTATALALINVELAHLSQLNSRTATYRLQSLESISHAIDLGLGLRRHFDGFVCAMGTKRYQKERQSVCTHTA